MVDHDADALLELSRRLRLCIVPMARGMRQRSAGYSPTEASLLGAVNTEGRISVGDLASRERLSSAVVSRAVARLVDEGLIVRLVDPVDRRRCLLELTSNGRRWIRRVRHERDRTMAARLREFTLADIAAVTEALPILEQLLYRG